jgi:signal peptidase I
VLIKRVIATGGDIVFIDDEGNVFVNSEKIEEDYVKEISYGNCNVTFPFQVPDEEVFVLGDNRETSIDSRNKSIGCISEDKILGKIIVDVNHLSFY